MKLLTVCTDRNTDLKLCVWSSRHLPISARQGLLVIIPVLQSLSSFLSHTVYGELFFILAEGKNTSV